MDFVLSKSLYRSVVGSFLLGLLLLAFATAPCRLLLGHCEVSAGVVFLGLYLWLREWVAWGDAPYAQRIGVLTYLVVGLLGAMLHGLGYFTRYAASSMIEHALWEYPLCHLFRAYVALVGLRALLCWEGCKPHLFKKGRPPELVGFLWDSFFVGVILILGRCMDHGHLGKDSALWMMSSFGSLGLGRMVHRLRRKCKAGKAREKNFSRHGQEAFPWGATFFLLLSVGICLMTNMLLVKHIAWRGRLCTAGVVTYPLTFLCMDVMSERYGRGKAKEAIWSGLGTNMLFLGGILLTGFFLEESLSGASLFWGTFGFVSSSLVASLVAYGGAQWVSVTLFHYMRRRMGGHHLWLRNNVTTLIGQAVDTGVFALVAWWIWYVCPRSEAVPLAAGVWGEIAANEYFLKVILALLDTPLLYMILALLGRKKTPRRVH